MEVEAGRLRRRSGLCRVVAHRGYSSAFPENSLESYERAIAAGADVVEIDLRHSRDRTVVCHHDATTEGANIADLSLHELTARGVVALSDVLPRLLGRVCLLFDLKLPTLDLAAAALSLLQDRAMAPQSVIGVRSLEQAKFVRKASAEIVILGFLPDCADFERFYALGGDIARLWEEDCSEDRLQAARCGDHPVWVTAGRRSRDGRPGDIDVPRLERLFRWNIDGILVNDPVQAIRVRDRQTDRSGLE